MKTQAIIPAAGIGVRLKSALPKPLILIRQRPIIAYTLDVFEQCPLVDSVILVVNENYLDNFKTIVSHYGFKKVVHVVPGGQTRQASVTNGLKVLDQETDLVVIHDGARPFVLPEKVSEAVVTAQKENAVIVGVPTKATIKQIDTQNSLVFKTLNRRELWEAQTPQVFKRELLVKAYEQAGDPLATDDSILVEESGQPVKMIMGDYKNIKITTEDDLLLAHVLVEQR